MAQDEEKEDSRLTKLKADAVKVRQDVDFHEKALKEARSTRKALNKTIALMEGVQVEGSKKMLKMLQDLNYVCIKYDAKLVQKSLLLPKYGLEIVFPENNEDFGYELITFSRSNLKYKDQRVFFEPLPKAADLSHESYVCIFVVLGVVFIFGFFFFFWLFVFLAGCSLQLCSI